MPRSSVDLPHALAPTIAVIALPGSSRLSSRHHKIVVVGQREVLGAQGGHDGGSVSAPGPGDRYAARMVRKVTATHAKARILTLLDEVAAGEEVEITKHGRVVARLTPATGPHALRGRFAGIAVSAADDEELFATGAQWEAG